VPPLAAQQSDQGDHEEEKSHRTCQNAEDQNQGPGADCRLLLLLSFSALAPARWFGTLLLFLDLLFLPLAARRLGLDVLGRSRPFPHFPRRRPWRLGGEGRLGFEDRAFTRDSCSPLGRLGWFNHRGRRELPLDGRGLTLRQA